MRDVLLYIDYLNLSLYTPLVSVLFAVRLVWSSLKLGPIYFKRVYGTGLAGAQLPKTVNDVNVQLANINDSMKFEVVIYKTACSWSLLLLHKL